MKPHLHRWVILAAIINNDLITKYLSYSDMATETSWTKNGTENYRLTTVTILLTSLGRVLLEKLIITRIFKNSPHFMDSLPCSQEPATDPFLEPHASSPQLPTIVPYDQFYY